MDSETAVLSLENLQIEIKDRIARVTIDRPEGPERAERPYRSKHPQSLRGAPR